MSKAASVRSSRRAGSTSRLRINFFQQLDDVAAQPAGAAGPMRVSREAFQTGDEQAQELDLIVVCGLHACIISFVSHDLDVTRKLA